MSFRTVAICVPLLWAANASANLGASRPYPALLSSAASTTEPPLHVIAEALSFDCREEGHEPTCEFEARYTFQNPTARYVSMLAAFYSHDARNVRIAQDGAVIERPLTADQVRDLDARVEAVSHPNAPSHFPPPSLSRTGAVVSTVPEARSEVVVTGTIRPGRSFKATYAVRTTHARHILLGSNPPPSDHFDFTYLVAPIRTWGGTAPRIRVTIRHPGRWRVTLFAAGASQGSPEDRIEVAGRTTTHQFAVDGNDADWLGVGIEVPPGAMNGGLLLGLGRNVDDEKGWRGRLGYEVAEPDWLFYSVNLETDFRRTLVLAPVVELATPSIFYVVPSIGMGIGVPIRLRPEVEIGCRGQLTIQWPFVGLVGAIDYYLGQGLDAPAGFQLALLGQVSL